MNYYSMKAEIIASRFAGPLVSVMPPNYELVTFTKFEILFLLDLVALLHS